MNSAASIMRSSIVVHGLMLWTCLFTATSVTASFSNVHFEFNEAANTLNAEYHNETVAVTEFSQRVARQIRRDIEQMIYDPKNRTWLCLPFNKTFKTHKTTEPKVEIRAYCRTGYIGRFTAIDMASPISINKAEDTVFNVSVLIRFSGFFVTYRNVSLTIGNDTLRRHASATMKLHDDAFFRLNMSYDRSYKYSARLLDVSMPHYRVAAFEMPGIGNNETYLVAELLPHIRHQFETVEKPQFVAFLNGLIGPIVRYIWFGVDSRLVNLKKMKKNNPFLPYVLERSSLFY